MRWGRRLGSHLFAAYVGAVVLALAIVPFGAGWLPFLKDYQTLMVGAPGLLAIGFALQQRRVELRRDTISVLKSYEPELDLLDDLQALVEQVTTHRQPSIVGALIGSRSRGHTIQHRVAKHIRSASHAAKAGIAPKADALAESIEYFNEYIRQVDQAKGALSDAEQEQLRISMDTIEKSAEDLLGAIQERRLDVRRLIDMYLELP